MYYEIVGVCEGILLWLGISKTRRDGIELYEGEALTQQMQTRLTRNATRSIHLIICEDG